MTDTLNKLAAVIEARTKTDPSESYVASLQHKGLNKILEKVGEEAIETILAARDAEQSGNNNDLICETADLWFHSLIMLNQLGTGPDAVLNELNKRFGISGLTEKASRKKT